MEDYISFQKTLKMIDECLAAGVPIETGDPIHKKVIEILKARPPEVSAPLETNPLVDFENKLYDFSSLPEDEKNKLVKEFIQLTAKHTLQLFIQLGLKTHIEAMVVNDGTKEEFIFSFCTTEYFKKQREIAYEKAMTEYGALERSKAIQECQDIFRRIRNDETEKTDLLGLLIKDGIEQCEKLKEPGK